LTLPAPLPWHTAQWSRLAAARDADRLPHALLLRGIQGLGKGLFARRLAASLLCTAPTASSAACGECAACRLVAAGSHPDLHRLAPEEPGRAIKIDAVRELVSKSVLSAQPDCHRVFIIEPAEAMNRAAANALLKTLEEPVTRTAMVLVSSNPDRLPGTVRSRCQQVTFGVPPADDAIAWLAPRVEAGSPRALLQIAGGAPLRALTAAAEDWLGQDAGLAGELAALRQRERNPLQVVEKWEEQPLANVISGLKRLTADLVRLQSGAAHVDLCHAESRAELQALCEGLDLRGLILFADDLNDADRAMSNNANAQMTLEHLVNRWLQLTRRGGR
jgi:DNA polymerase-3 subunit delta'